MAQIRPMQISPVDFGQSNALRAAAQQQLTGGLGAFSGLVTGLRNEAIQRNTASATNLINGATSPEDLAARQQQVSQLLQQYGGDVDNQAIAKAQAAMPDTLLSRASNQATLTNQQNALADQQVQGKASALLAQGDFKGAAQYLGQLHDPTKLTGMLLDAQHQQAQEALQRQGLAQSAAASAASRALQQQEFGLRKQQFDAQQAQRVALLKQIQGMGGTGGIPSSPLAQADIKDGIAKTVTNAGKNTSQDDISTGAKNNLSTLIDAANGSRFWRTSQGDHIASAMQGLKGADALSPLEQANLFKIGQNAYGNASFFSPESGEQLATQAMQEALNQHQVNVQTQDKAAIMQNTFEAQQQQQRRLQQLLGGSYSSY